jgi:hypothetical protein
MSDNLPNHKSSQKFVFHHPYEAKHAIGVQHTKRLEFESREGIATVKFVEGMYRSQFGLFVIDGKPSAVDRLMVEIARWLAACQTMHFEEFL